MRYNRLFVILIMFASMSLHSCFEIREIVRLNRDGSGTFSLVLDMSELKQMLKGFGENEEVAAESPLQDMEEKYDETMEKLKATDGISNARLESEEDGYVVISSYDFSDLEALNRGMEIIYGDEEPDDELNSYYVKKRRKFERTAAHDFLYQIKNEFDMEASEAEGMDLSAIFSDVAYVNQVIFEDMEVRKVRKGLVEVSDDAKSITNRYLIFNEEKEQSLEYVLKIK